MNIIEITPLRHPIKAVVEVPGSKSYTNRALLLAALTENRIVIKNPLFCDDTNAMIACLKTLGIKLKIAKNQIEIIGSYKDVEEKEYNLDTDLSGTTIRFILALSTIIPGVKKIYGKEGLNNRPIKDLVDALRQLGADITYLGKEGYPPLRVTSSKLTPGTINMSGEISSQYLSALLMIAPIIGEITINVKDKQISKPYVDMTIEAIRNFGVSVNNQDYKKYIVAKNQHYHADNYIVEGDYSSAGYFAALAALTKSKITLKNLNPNSLQADKKLLNVLKKMDSEIILGDQTITIKGNGVQPLDLDVTDFPDQAQTLAVLAAFAKGVTKLSGIQSLRVKETNRATALQTELQKMGIKTTVNKDVLTIFGGNPEPALINTYGDHRMAMAFAIAGAKLAGIKINHPEVVSKTFPTFWNKLNDLKIKTKKKTNIVLIGMRGGGKTTIGKMLANKLKKQYFDLDEILINKSGIGIAEMINQQGWDYFRKIEAKAAQSMGDTTDAIISTGGGIILNEKNIMTLKQHGIFIFLNAHPKILSKRIGNDTKRPPLNKGYSSKEELELVLREREPLYKKYADTIIDTNKLNQKEVINRIINQLII